MADEQRDDEPKAADEVADAWAVVLIDAYEKRKNGATERRAESRGGK